MKKIGNILIVFGVLMIIFVIYTKVKVNFEQQKLMEEFDSLTFETTVEASSEEPVEVEINNGDVIGLLEIPKIELKTPVVEGASQDNMRHAVGHLPSSGSHKDLGEKNMNFSIAGHRNAAYGKFFNRLDEMEVGDELILSARGSVYTYVVSEKKIVAPTEVEVTYPVKDKSLMTLITCHPMYSNKQRLIIIGEFAHEKKLDGSELQH